ncbi:MAG: hypothetical protein DHS20C15_12100 [Planctomycetota bacterium]|nr:MAG: hypothetical protein DHS20C15_12100 [Planctomycetota bacterium]
MIGLLGLGVLVVLAIFWLLDERGDEAAHASRPDVARDSETSSPDLLIEAARNEPRALDESPITEAASSGRNWPAGVIPIRLSGRVVDERGAPWPGARVLFVADGHTMSTLPKEERLGLADGFAQLPRTRTDQDGRFEIEGPWQSRREHASSHSHMDPMVAITDDEMAWQGHSAAGFLGESVDLGDLVLRMRGSSFSLRAVDEQGTPLAGVTATYNGGRLRARTDDDPLPPHRVEHHLAGPSGSDGRLLVEHLWPATPNMKLEVAGRETTLVKVELEYGKHVELGDVLIPRGRSIRGAVFDTSGQALPDALVRPMRNSSGTELDQRSPQARDVAAVTTPSARDETSATSDAHGRFVLTGLPSKDAEVALLATAPGFRSALLRDVALDSEEVTFTLERAASYSVSVLSARDGSALHEASVLAMQRTGIPEKPPADGISEWLWRPFLPLDVESGSFVDSGPLGVTLFVAAAGHRARRLDLEPAAPGASETVIVELEPALSVRGQVLDDQGEPVRNARLETTPAAPYERMFENTERHSDEQGRFEFPLLQASSWVLRASKPGYLETTLDPLPWDLIEEPLEVVLERQAQLRGRLLAADGSPAVGEWVRATSRKELDAMAAAEADPEVRPETLRGRWFMLPRSWARADRNGEFTFTSLHPGDWRIEAAPGVDLWVTVELDSVIDLALQLEPGTLLHGVTRQAGLPLAQVLVSAKRVEENPNVRVNSTTTRSAADGNYQLTLPGAGHYDVLFNASAGTTLKRNVELRAASTAELNVEFGTAAIGGRAFFGPERGAPPERARVSLHLNEAHVDSSDLDAEGRFLFEPLEPGDYHLKFSGSLVQPTEFGPISLGDGERRLDLEVFAERAAQVSGLVRRKDGTGFEGYLHLRRIDGPEHYLIAGLSLDNEWYWFSSLPPGEWRLDLADFYEQEMGRGPGLRGEPGVELPLIATEFVTLSAGQDLRLDITAPPLSDH